MASLTLIRHGQSTFSLANLFTGNVDVPLTALGEPDWFRTNDHDVRSFVIAILMLSH